VSNGVFSVAVGSLELRLPVREASGAQVSSPLPVVMPAGYAAVLGERKAGSRKATRKRKARTRCVRRGAPRRVRRGRKCKRATRKRATRRSQPRFTG
jgi:hypothetical protein